MKVYELLAPLGIAAYIFLALAFLSGFLKLQFHVKWINLKWHLWLGVLAIISATLHLAIFIYTNL